jgi:hypothetical protein
LVNEISLIKEVCEQHLSVTPSIRNSSRCFVLHIQKNKITVSVLLLTIKTQSCSPQTHHLLTSEKGFVLTMFALENDVKLMFPVEENYAN